MHHTKGQPDFATAGLSSLINETEFVVLAHKTLVMTATAAVIAHWCACCRAQPTCRRQLIFLRVIFVKLVTAA